ncbi:MAG: hydrolase 1, exosortase A system-associated [Burkholderiaceae bacterium]|nr:hydrolase 1, exosortase A system-associated [Burkholderiaceae bacterium]
MSFQEVAVQLNCGTDRLLGILARPEGPSSTGVVIIVGGPQYRVGSHRQFVLLARRLAEAGHAVLRFDYRGMGDSEGSPRDFESVSDDVAAAIDTLQGHIPTIKKVVLWGLCDAASAALLYCHQTRDARVAGLCLLNPWVRSEASLARTQIKHYYLQRLRQKEFWLKALSGKVAMNALSGLLRSLRLSLQPTESVQRLTSFQDRMAQAWRRFDGDILLLLSGNDYTAKEFIEYVTTDPQWAAALNHPRLSRHDMPGLDHTCSGATAGRLVEDHTLTWLSRRGSSPP